MLLEAFPSVVDEHVKFVWNLYFVCYGVVASILADGQQAGIQPVGREAQPEMNQSVVLLQVAVLMAFPGVYHHHCAWSQCKDLAIKAVLASALKHEKEFLVGVLAKVEALGVAADEVR